MTSKMDLAFQQNPSIDLGTDYIQLTANPDIVPVETALGRIFDVYHLERLGGASGGRGWSSYSTIQRCPYLYKVKYLDGYRGEPSGNLEIGSLIHTYLAIEYQKHIERDYPLTPEKVKDELLNENANAANVLESWRIYSAYANYYENDYLIPVATEVLAKAPNGDSCRYDGIVRIDDPCIGFPTGLFIAEHKCLVASSEIYDQSTGKLWTVGELSAEKHAPLVLACDADYKLVATKASIPRPVGQRPVYHVKLRSGRSLDTSDNHPFMTAGGWVPAAKLTTNDWVAVPSTAYVVESSSAFSDDEVEFVGFMLGDGSMSEKSGGGPNFCSSGNALERFLIVIKSLGYQHNVCYSNGNRSPMVQFRLHSQASKLVKQLGLSGHLAATKFMPREMLSLGFRQTGLLLGGLWNTDGCVDTFNEKGHIKVRIAYVSRSKELCEGVQKLLHKMGIQTTVTYSTVEYKSERRDVWTTKVVYRENKRRFYELVKRGVIPFVNYQIGDKIAEVKANDDRPIPTELIRRLVPDSEMSGVFRACVNKFQAMARFALAKHGKHIKAAAQILESDVNWERVASVIVVGEETLYDITVPKLHNFVANGIITHNTSAIFDRAVLDGWRNDGEVIGQQMIWKAGGFTKKYGKLQGTIMNIIGKQKTPKFERIIIPVQDQQIKQHKHDLEAWRALEGMYRAMGRWPRARTSCITKYGFCDLYEHCADNIPLNLGKKKNGGRT